MPDSLYAAFGLTISSCLPCPELLPGSGACDAKVVYGGVPQRLDGATQVAGFPTQAAPGQLMFDVDNVARFLVRDGREIVIDRYPVATDDEVRLFLLGSAFGALMHQRGILVLHGSTVKVGDGCVVFLGRSGAGKSTLATELSRRGYAYLGDDLCAVSIGEDGVPYAAAAYPQAKLTIDSLEHFGIDPQTLRRIRPSHEKRAVPLQGFSPEERIAVKRLYVLSPASKCTELVITPISGSIKVRALLHHTYRRRFLRGMGLEIDHFKQIAHLASRLPVSRVIRPRRALGVEYVANAIEADLQAQLSLAGTEAAGNSIEVDSETLPQ